MLQEWFNLLTGCVLLKDGFSPVNVSYPLSTLKKKSCIWWCHEQTNCVLLLWFSSSRTLMFMSIRWTHTRDSSRNLNQATLSRWVNLREDGTTCQNHRATYCKNCSINPEAPNIRLAQPSMISLNIQIYERAKALILK